MAEDSISESETFDVLRQIFRGITENSKRSGFKVGFTNLHYAALFGLSGLAKDELEKGADINMTDNEGSTPLHVACEVPSNEECIQTLLAYNPNVNMLNHALDTPLGNYLIYYNLNSDILKTFVKLGANPNSQNLYGNTPLHFLAMYPQEKFGQFQRLLVILIESGADFNKRNNRGDSPLHLAVRFNFRMCVKLFLDYGECDIYLKNIQNISPMDMAYKNRETNPMMFILFGREVMIRIMLKMKVEKEHLYAILGWKCVCCFLEECAKEVLTLKSVKLAGTHVTLFKILTSSTSVVAKHFRNESILESCKGYRVHQCGNFNDRLFTKIERGLLRMEAEKKTYSSCRKLFFTLPYPCLDKIVSHLSNEDLHNILRATKKDKNHLRKSKINN